MRRKRSRARWSRPGRRAATVKPVSSPEEVLAIARSHPDREVVFFAAGFETTTAPVAGLVARALQRAGRQRQRLARQPDLAAVRPADLAGGRAAARQRDAGFRRAGRARPRVDGNGPGGVGVRSGKAWHSRGGRGLHHREPAGGVLLGAQTGHRAAAVPGQLLRPGRQARRQPDRARRAGPGHGRHRRQLARHRRHSRAPVSR